MRDAAFLAMTKTSLRFLTRAELMRAQLAISHLLDLRVESGVPAELSIEQAIAAGLIDEEMTPLTRIVTEPAP